MHSMNPAGQSDFEKCMLLYFDFDFLKASIIQKIISYWLEAVLIIVWTVESPCHPFHIDRNHTDRYQLHLWFPTCQSAMPIIEFSWQSRPSLASLVSKIFLFPPWRIRVILNLRIMEEAINKQLEETLGSNCCVRKCLFLLRKE